MSEPREFWIDPECTTPYDSEQEVIENQGENHDFFGLVEISAYKELQAKLERAESKISIFNKQDAEWPKVVNRMAQMKDKLALAEKRIAALRECASYYADETMWFENVVLAGPDVAIDALAADNKLSEEVKK